ncbi:MULTISPECIES: sulfite oxidase-like oxidoreductase [Acidiplasma]|jgi:DMSO/TMAO reductase YedYZ molybdopterin-dependent catalytic subunit|uniref:Oxidoreductase n=1 Tax=Acidiplasma cupricumulans TaxID=312540 RepID=A0A0Q0S0R8_9ARCH|nr:MULTISPECIES: sulfite oxidase-like oxidoreductase [Acidiplasma]KJE48863.1 oxidoreductase [Acidiplasma sp. MBA-1]KQB36587.1 oxidoreductase [Acidiplasma cupricumulans]WMT54262.1 MAG: sulfite oxidase-like oxidoreductase [Acidiplasma sp.]
MEKIEIKNPGQHYVNNFILYDALGGPVINENLWKLRIDGIVKKPMEYTYNELNSMTNIEYISDFNCVTKWSVKDVKWTGPSLRDLILKSEPEEDAEWVMFICADGYDTPVPYDDAIDEKSIIALKMNDKPLAIEHGFPARPFIPSLYGWKSAKWLTEIKIMRDYEDGYWESYGYHERGKIEDEERFKGFAWRKIKRKSKIDR